MYIYIYIYIYIGFGCTLGGGRPVGLQPAAHARRYYYSICSGLRYIPGIYFRVFGIFSGLRYILLYTW